MVETLFKEKKEIIIHKDCVVWGCLFVRHDAGKMTTVYLGKIGAALVGGGQWEHVAAPL